MSPMTAPARTEPDNPERDVDDGIPQFGKFAYLMFGVFAGFMVTAAIAFVVLMGRTSAPNYVEVSQPTSGAAASAPGEVQGEVVLTATEFAFQPDPTSGPSALEIVLENRGFIFHNLEVEGVAGFIIEAEAGATERAAIALEPGAYTIFCSVPGHRDAGMEATLNIEG